MSRILHIARREWVEQVRQPAMLAVMFTLFALVAGVVLAGLGVLEIISADPRKIVGLAAMLGGEVEGEAALQGMAGLFVVGYNFLMLSQFLGISAVLAGHAVLHDRQCGTLTFLLLAPVSRAELLVGKVFGAMGPAFLFYFVVSGSTWFAISLLSVSDAFPVFTPASSAWWVAFLVGGPLWSAFISTVCTIVSSLAHDVRTAQQVVWFVVFFGTLLCGFLLTNALPSGLAMQVFVAVIGGAGALGSMVVGSLIIQRDLGR